jgi:hypothetical protein
MLGNYRVVSQLVASRVVLSSLSALLDVRFSNRIAAAGIIRIYVSFQSMRLKESIRGRNYLEGCFAGRITCKCLYAAKASVDDVMKFHGTYLWTEETWR